MELPFTQDQFLEVFATYNDAIWPVQPLAGLLGVAAVGLVFVGLPWADRAISLILTFFWAFTAIVYHWLHFSEINRAAWIFGALFLLAAAVFFVEGAIRSRIRFAARSDPGGWTGAMLIVYGLVAYPALGLIWTHPYPQTPLFGVAPCPTTIFTIGILLLATHRRPRMLAALPLVWAIIGASAAILLGVPEDLGLLIAVAAWLFFGRKAKK